MLNFIAGTYPLIAALFGWLAAQLAKVFIYSIKDKKLQASYFFRSGGFPSSHTSTMSSLLTAIGLAEGFQSTLFAITLVLTFIIAYDAINVRYYAGKNIELTQQLLTDLKDEQSVSLNLKEAIYHTKLKDVLGHKKTEVLCGFLLGIIIAFSFYKLYY